MKLFKKAVKRQGLFSPKPYVSAHKNQFGGYDTACRHMVGGACHGCMLAVSGRDRIVYNGTVVTRDPDGSARVGDSGEENNITSANFDTAGNFIPPGDPNEQ